MPGVTVAPGLVAGALMPGVTVAPGSLGPGRAKVRGPCRNSVTHSNNNNYYIDDISNNNEGDQSYQQT